MPNAVEELLRFEAPSPVQARYVNEDIVIHGQTVPEGSAMVLVNGSANHDERKWGPTSEEFDMRRKMDHHLSFGYGLHFCLGAALARLELRIVLEQMLDRFGAIAPEGPVKRSGSSIIAGLERAPLLVASE